tara:strand:- start:2454 stop:2726 length:273 start_codon:yes stop_codon:yes gene_type:complete
MDESSFDDLMKIQRMTASHLARESEVDDTITVLTTIQGMVPNKEGLIQVESVLIECSHNGMPNSKVGAIIEKLKEDGLVSEPKQGYLRLE